MKSGVSKISTVPPLARLAAAITARANALSFDKQRSNRI
jgi:hypothetical protein